MKDNQSLWEEALAHAEALRIKNIDQELADLQRRLKTSVCVNEMLTDRIEQLESDRPKSLSRRDQFAMAAMQGILSRGERTGLQNVVESSVLYADSITAELDKSPSLDEIQYEAFNEGFKQCGDQNHEK